MRRTQSTNRTEYRKILVMVAHTPIFKRNKLRASVLPHRCNRCWSIITALTCAAGKMNTSVRGGSTCIFAWVAVRSLLIGKITIETLACYICFGG